MGSRRGLGPGTIRRNSALDLATRVSQEYGLGLRAWTGPCWILLGVDWPLRGVASLRASDLARDLEGAWPLV